LVFLAYLAPWSLPGACAPYPPTGGTWLSRGRFGEFRELKFSRDVSNRSTVHQRFKRDQHRAGKGRVLYWASSRRRLGRTDAGDLFGYFVAATGLFPRPSDCFAHEDGRQKGVSGSMAKVIHRGKPGNPRFWLGMGLAGPRGGARGECQYAGRSTGVRPLLSLWPVLGHDGSDLPGPVEGTPGRLALDATLVGQADGPTVQVRPGRVWAALDCPSYFALHGSAHGPSRRHLGPAKQVGDRRAASYGSRVLVVLAGRSNAPDRKGRRGDRGWLDLDGTVLAHAESSS